MPRPGAELPPHAENLPVIGLITGVALLHPHHAPIDDVLVASEADTVDLPPAHLDEVGVGHGPHLVTLRAEVLEAEAGLGGIGNHAGTPVLDVLNATDVDAGRVDVHPVVIEGVRLVGAQNAGRLIALAQPLVGRALAGRAP